MQPEKRRSKRTTGSRWPFENRRIESVLLDMKF